ncbi:MAG: glycosyltransferase family 2 protein [Caldilineaceae bacterium]
MKTSVIIPVWNGAHFLPTCLDSLLAQQTGDTLEVIVVDNASTDNSAALIAQRYPQVRLLRNSQNQGFAGGCNRGLEAAQGDVLVLLNQDTQVQRGWLTALLQALRDPAHGVVGCKILYPDGKTIQHAGGWIDWPLGLSHHYGQGEVDQGQWNQSRSVEFVTGAALAVRRDVLAQVGLLDEGFWPGYFEDNDFCLRVTAAGYTVYYAADAVVFHQESASWSDQRAKALAYQRGRLRFLLKHLPPPRFLTEFVPAEQKYQPGAIGGQGSAALQAAYTHALLIAPRLLAEIWQADAATVRLMIHTLRELGQQAWQAEQAKTKQRLANLSPSVREPFVAFRDEATAVPQLTEFGFHSELPVVGVFITALRTFWYNMAARWGIRHLGQQQEFINQQLTTQVQALQQQVEALTMQNVVLVQQLMDLERTQTRNGQTNDRTDH